MSYQQVPQEERYPVGPPQYTSVEDQNYTPGEGAPARADGDDVPDDFKYSTSVASCELSIRQAFIRRVYTILSAQLLVTGLIGFVVSHNKSVQAWALTHIWAFYVSLFGAIALMVAAFIKQRSYPINMVFLGGFTVLEAYSIGTVSSLYDTRVVIQAVGITTIVFVGLTLFAMQTRYDITKWQGILGALLWGMIGFGLISMFFPFGSKVELVYSALGALVFSGYIMVDTQLIMKRYHPEDEVAASISLYLDIINLFLYILRILNEVQDN